MIECLHVVQTVDEFNDENANVLTGGNKELAKTFVVSIASIVSDRTQLRHALNQKQNLVTEGAADIVRRHVGVLNRVMEKTGGDGTWPHAHLCKPQPDLSEMRHIRFARIARMPGVCFFCTFVRFLHERTIRLCWTIEFFDYLFAADHVLILELIYVCARKTAGI